MDPGWWPKHKGTVSIVVLALLLIVIVAWGLGAWS